MYYIVTQINHTGLIKMAYNKQITSIFSEPNVRRWLRAHGKKQTITFDDDDRVELRRYFASLDEEGKGSIGIKELEEPLIALGLANSRKDVEDMIVEVDIDQSGNIEFDEFLEILGG